MVYLILFLDYLLWLYLVIIVVWAVMSWLIAFNVINTHHPFVRSVVEFLYRATEPVLRPIRRLLPDLGGIDVSPVIVFLIIMFIRRVIFPNLLVAVGASPAPLS